MKKQLTTLAVIIALSGGVLVSTSGCAGITRGRSAGEMVSDATITTKVKAEFVKDPAVKALDVDVDTLNGNVQLNGTVDTTDQKARAEQIARGVNGVMNVQNNLHVKGQVTP